MTQGETPGVGFGIAMYRNADGPRAAVVHHSGRFVDVNLVARALAGELEPFKDVTDIQEMLDAGLNLDLLSPLASIALGELPPASVISSADVTLQTPVRRPGKVIAVGLNVPGLAGGPVPLVDEMPSTAPFWFTKASTAVIGHGESIIHPGKTHTTQMIPEPELAMIIGRRCGPGIATPRAEQAAKFIAGWSICNDVSALDIEFERGGAPFAYNLTWSKSYPTFSPIGPWLARLPSKAVRNLSVSMKVNDEVICEYDTSQLLWSPFELLEYFAAVLILEPGDIISCGNAPPVKIIDPGDRVDIDIARIGRLSNAVVATPVETQYRIPEKATQFAQEYREYKMREFSRAL